MKQNKKAGFTLVEIMIVVAIIALLAAIAVPSFMKAREQSIASACQNNLRQISGAKDEYALAHTNQMPTALADLIPDYIKVTPTCRGGGTYTLGNATTEPTCGGATTTIPHTL